MTDAADQRFIYEPLDVARHNRAAFVSGSDPLDRYFKERARKDHEADIATCFVLYDQIDDLVVGYYTLSATHVLAQSLPTDMTKRLSRYPYLPATLLGRLAVDARWQGQGWGARLLIDACRRAATAAQIVGSLLLVVDAKPDVVAWYPRYGFIPFADAPDRLYLPMTTIRHLLPP